jgi:hypothetical protein
MEHTMNLVQKAQEFATRKHAEINHVRKYTGEPYIVHPAEVVEIVQSVDHTECMLAAAWLHDTVEDTNTTIAEIEQEFGSAVMLYVKGLTDISKPEDGNRKIRKTIDRIHLSKQHPNTMTIKLADLISNSHSIIEEDPGFAKVYLEEKRLLLGVLQDGDQTLWQRAHNIAYANYCQKPLLKSRWKHINNNQKYTVLMFTNEHSENSKYSVQVVYQGDNQRIWNRSLADWHRSMLPL